MIFNTIFGDVEDYIIEIYEGNALINRQKMTAPPFVAEQQFKQLCIQCKQSGRPMRCKIIKYAYMQGRDTPLETYIELQTWED